VVATSVSLTEIFVLFVKPVPVTVTVAPGVGFVGLKPVMVSGVAIVSETPDAVVEVMSPFLATMVGVVPAATVVGSVKVICVAET